MALWARPSREHVSWSTTTGYACDPPHTAGTSDSLKALFLEEKKKRSYPCHG